TEHAEIAVQTDMRAGRAPPETDRAIFDKHGADIANGRGDFGDLHIRIVIMRNNNRRRALIHFGLERGKTDMRTIWFRIYEGRLSAGGDNHVDEVEYSERRHQHPAPAFTHSRLYGEIDAEPAARQ